MKNRTTAIRSRRTAPLSAASAPFFPVGAGQNLPVQLLPLLSNSSLKKAAVGCLFISFPLLFHLGFREHFLFYFFFCFSDEGEHFTVQGVADDAARGDDDSSSSCLAKGLVDLSFYFVLMAFCDVHAFEACHEAFACQEGRFADFRKGFPCVPVENLDRVFP